MLINKIIIFYVLSAIPFIESRLAIPYGIAKSGLDMHPLLVLILGVALSFLGGVVVFEFAFKIKQLFLKLKNKFGWIKKHHESKYNEIILRVRTLVDKYAHWGLALFIIIPLPGSGTMTAALLAQLVLRMSRGHYYLANIIGSTINTGLIVALSLGLINI